ncbi:MAG: hypothetical protein QNJ48_03110 [Desulfobacterales bacterium]|nr:hypothetical protein [Desulfobacterales bacterium]MDJ0876689.1 hypothetical protein [Desulfobacterales bacterium]MDJ0883118.1 hypothetical protein [Desulfobacterales bacterium]
MEDFMEEGQPIEFVVGETYENEKGLFEVLSIQRDAMVIKWESGESIETTVSFQRRIQERRRWERQMREKKAAASSSKARRAAGRKPGSTFEGFHPEDFKKTISRTPWRSRSQFGGAVTSRLQSSRLKFNSWAAKRRNEVHWADSNHWKTKSVDYPAKFFARADLDTLAWGFYIERPETGRNASPDWQTFLTWLRNDDNDNWLREVAREQGLVVYDAHQRSFGGLLEPQEEQWRVSNSTGSDAGGRLAAIIDSWPSETWLDLMIAKRISKDEALERGQEVAADAALLFGHLFPLYEAAAFSS